MMKYSTAEELARDLGYKTGLKVVLNPLKSRYQALLMTDMILVCKLDLLNSDEGWVIGGWSMVFPDQNGNPL